MYKKYFSNHESLVRQLLIIGLIANPIALLIQSCVLKMGINFSYLDKIGGLIRLACFAIIIILQRKTISRRYLLYLALFIAIVGINYFAYPSNQGAIKSIFLTPGVAIIFSMGLAFSSFQNAQLVFDSYVKVALPIVILNFLNFLLYSPGVEGLGMTYLSFGYQSLIFVAFLIVNAYRKRSRSSYLSAIICSLLVILLSNRGAALLTLAVLVVFYFYYGNPKKRFKTITVSLLLVALFFSFLPTIAKSINTGLGYLGLTSRSFIGLESKTEVPNTELELESNFRRKPATTEPKVETPEKNANNAASTKASVMSRLAMWKKSIEKILITPFIGDGIGVDRVIFGVYVHNFVLEFLLNFGLFFGTLLLALLLASVIKVLFIRNSDWRDSILILFLIGFGTLLFSFSFYSHYESNLAIALLFAYISNSSLKGMKL